MQLKLAEANFVDSLPKILDDPEKPPSRTRHFDFKRDAKPFEDYRNDRRGEPNIILDNKIRVTKIGRWQWHQDIKQWSGFGEQWNRFSRTWSEPRWFHCNEFECEGNTASQI